MGNEFFAALIGAGAALVGQIISGFFHQKSLAGQISISKRQIALSAETLFMDRKLSAIVRVRNILQTLSDNDITAKDAYFEIRPDLIFLKSETEQLVTKAIEAVLKSNDISKEVAEEMMASALQDLKEESVAVWSKYDEQ